MVESEDIFFACCEVFKISPENLKSRHSKRFYIYPRMAYSFICKKFLPLTYEEIGEKIGKRKNNIQYYLSAQPVDDYYKSKLDACIKLIQNPR
jgi:hypothetical protein